MSMKRLMYIGLGGLFLNMSFVPAANATRTREVSTSFGVQMTVLAVCSVTAMDLDFGEYNPTTVSDTEGTTSIQVNCSPGTEYTVKLSTGQSTDYAMRYMNQGTHYLNYNLYTESAGSTVWGNESSGTGTVSGVTSGSYTVYGKIPKNQFQSPSGIYNDTIDVCVEY